MKKSDFILIGLVIIIIVVGVLSSRGNKELEKIDFPLQLSGKVGLNQITYSDYETMVENKEAFVVIIERAGCSYCVMYMPIVEEVAKELGVSINYIDTDTLTQEEYEKLSTTNEYLKKNQWGTPTTLFMLGDRVIDAIGGYVEKDTVIEFLKDRVVTEE